jgi:nitrite reductase/ring-hydroxylating ferredoxin subunit
MDYVYAARIRDVPSGSIKCVEGVDRVPVCLINLQGKFFAISGICGHKGARLWEGRVKGEFLECPSHGALFRIRDGKNGWPAPRPVRSYPVMVKGKSIYIGTEPQGNSS